MAKHTVASLSEIVEALQQQIEEITKAVQPMLALQQQVEAVTKAVQPIVAQQKASTVFSSAISNGNMSRKQAEALENISKELSSRGYPQASQRIIEQISGWNAQSERPGAQVVSAFVGSVIDYVKKVRNAQRPAGQAANSFEEGLPDPTPDLSTEDLTRKNPEVF